MGGEVDLLDGIAKRYGAAVEVERQAREAWVAHLALRYGVRDTIRGCYSAAQDLLTLRDRGELGHEHERAVALAQAYVAATQKRRDVEAQVTELIPR
jgi:hypothetical protein